VAWKDLPEDIRQQAEQTLTPHQLAVVKLQAGGLSWSRIAEARDVTPEAIRGTYQRATLRLRKNIAADA
jgi:hypothetical protein